MADLNRHSFFKPAGVSVGTAQAVLNGLETIRRPLDKVCAVRATDENKACLALINESIDAVNRVLSPKFIPTL